MDPKKFIFTFCLFISVAFAASAQNDTVALTTVIAKTAKFGNDYPVEKVYLHFDKPYYAVGDTIWFKAYVTVGDHELSALSRIVYVDMITNHDSVVQSLRIPVINGVGNGSIVLPQLTFIEGNYHVRAYTNWMRNFDNAYFFYKNIVVGNTVDERNPVNTHISFINSINGITEPIDAKIIFKDQDGNVYSNRKVSWKVLSDDETIDKGKGVTDANGVLEVNVSSNKPGSFGTADLVTDLEINYKKSITSSFSLKTAAIPKDVQFFPEGGNLVSGIRTRVAFKAVSSNGLGVDVKGTITDNDNKVVADFASRHLGMGVFVMIPDANKNYKANVTFPDGTQSSYDLPRVMDEGIDLAVYNNTDSIVLKISSNADFLQKFNSTRFYILAQSGGIIYYAAQTNLRSLVHSAAIPKSKFPTGIVQVSLLSSEGDPLSERVVFVQNNDLLNVVVNTDHQVYAQRQRVRMSMLVKNKDIPVSGSFSIAVTDETKAPFDENSETTILSNLLLTSDLKGYIEKPNYYFNLVDSTRRSNLDILMLTQGYRRFTYSDIVYDKLPGIQFLPEQGIDLTGTLRLNSGISVPHGNVHLTIPDKIFYSDAVTDSYGNFRFKNLNFQDSSQVILNAKNNANSKYLELTANPETIPNLIKNINAPDNVVNIDSMLTTYLQNTKRQYSSTRMLKEVVIKAKSTEKKPSHTDYSSLAGLSADPDHLIHGEQLQGCNNLLECLRASAFGLTFDNDNFYITRDYMAGNKSTPVQVYLDGIPVEVSYLNTISTSSVESAEIFLNNGITDIGKLNNTKGVLEINSKKIPKGEKITLAQLKELMPEKNVITITPQGYAKVREFYVPKYTVATRINEATPDLRTTVYWNPKIITDKATGKASFDFFNADGKGTYRAVIEGIDIDGNLAHYVYHYKVE